MVRNQLGKDFSDLVTEHIAQSGFNLAQLARQSGVPRMTLLNWREGQVKKPRFWQDLVKMAKALYLDQYDTELLLQSAGYPPIAHLAKQAQNSFEQGLLSVWQEKEAPASPPFQTIRDLATFVGRETVLQTVASHLKADSHSHVYVLEGACGVGKTVVAARLAYQLRPHPSTPLRTSFPDGILWARVDLSDPLSILRHFATAYGLDTGAYTDVSSLSAAVRGLLAEKKALVVLDNVASEQEIEPFLPPSGRCAVLVTTRQRNLLGLAAHYFSISPFSPEEALSLFALVLGADRVEKERALLLAIGEAVGFLPLAIDIAACRLVFDQALSAQELLERLQAPAQLDVLNFCDRSVEIAVEASFDLLPTNEQQFLVALTIFAGREFSLDTVANATHVSVREASEILGNLFSLGFVRLGQSPNSYRLIPTIQSFLLAQNGNHESNE